MFSKFKHRFGAKSKKTIALLTIAALLCGLTGCNSNESSSISSDGAMSGLLSTSVAESKNSKSSETNSGNTGLTDDPNGAQLEFDFDEAVKNITLFGQQISLPCKWSDFDENFSYGNDFVPADNDLSCPLLYNGKAIGVIFFGNCDVEHTYEIETKPIVCISIGHYNYGYPYKTEELDWLDRAGYYLGLLEFSFGELTMESTEENIKNFLGNPSNDSEGYNCHYLEYDYDNGYLLFTINDEAKRNGRLFEMHVYVEIN